MGIKYKNIMPAGFSFAHWVPSALCEFVSHAAKNTMHHPVPVRLDLEQEVATRCCVQERLEKKMAELDQVADLQFGIS